MDGTDLGVAAPPPGLQAPTGPPGRLRLPRTDIALALGLIVFSWVFLNESGLEPARYWLDVLLAVGLAGPLAWRRVRPEQSALVIFAVGVVQAIIPSSGLILANLSMLFAIYALSAYGKEWVGSVSLITGLAASLIGVARYAAWPWSGADVGLVLSQALYLASFLGLLVLVVWGLGALRRSRIARRDALVERARLVEVERAQQLRLAAQAERTRIARDLHDVVAHSLAVMITQADGGRYAARVDPEVAVQALETIAETGRTALSEMRRLLGVLRDETPNPNATTPQPGLEDVAELVEGLRSGGLDVRLESQGTPAPMPQGMGVAAYRIVQEGLTNVLKHAGPDAGARVCVWWSPAALTVDVVDDGRGAGATPSLDGPGHGLLGMRERAAVYGGSVQSGPMPGGGFGVRAVFPLAFTPTAMPGVRA